MVLGSWHRAPGFVPWEMRWEEHLLCVSCCVFVVGQTIQIVDKAYQNLSLDKLIRLELNLVGYSHLLGMARS